MVNICPFPNLLPDSQASELVLMDVCQVPLHTLENAQVSLTTSPGNLTRENGFFDIVS